MKELCSQFGEIFSAFLKTKFSQVIAIIKDIRDNLDTLGEVEHLGKLVDTLIDCQVVVLKVLECPSNSKLVEILE